MPKPIEKPRSSARASTLPRKLELELRRAARINHEDDVVVAMERYERARAAGRMLDALRAAQKAKEAAPRAPVIREALGLTAFAAGHLKDAQQELLTWRRLTGKRTHDPVIAECYRRTGKPLRALEILEGLDKRSVPARAWMSGVIARARALHELGREGEANAVVARAASGMSANARAQLEKAAQPEGDIQ